jgi:hypothetical protein
VAVTSGKQLTAETKVGRKQKVNKKNKLIKKIEEEKFLTKFSTHKILIKS